MKKFIFATVALSKLVFAQNNNENTQSYELEASVIEGSYDEDKKYSSSYTIGERFLQSNPSGNGDITSILRTLPNVQYDNAQLKSTTPGEIEPAKISISGGLHYQNNFLLDGVNINNDLDPAGTGSWTGRAPSRSQGLAIDTSLLESVKVLDSNIGAAYGGFTGGVIEAKTKRPSESFSADISYQITQGKANGNFSLTHYHLYKGNDKEDFINSYDDSNQPNFVKHIVRASFESKINEKLGFIGAFTTTRSIIPLRRNDDSYLGTSGNSLATPIDPENSAFAKQNQKRQIDNYFIKGYYDMRDDIRLELSYTYAPQHDTYYIVGTVGDFYSFDSGGHQVSSKMMWYNSLGFLSHTLSYSYLENSTRTNFNATKYWQSSDSKRWSNWATWVREGGYAPSTSLQQTLTNSVFQEFNPFELSISEHIISTGFEFSYQDAHFKFSKPYDSAVKSSTFMTQAQQALCEQSDKAWCDSAKAYDTRGFEGYAYTQDSNPFEIIDNWNNNGVIQKYLVWKYGQYFNEITRFNADKKIALHNKILAYFLQDDIKIKFDKFGAFNLRFGLRFDYDSYMSKLTKAPRFSLSYVAPWHSSHFPTQITTGLNRYYGRNILAYALNDGLNALKMTLYRDSPSTSWEDIAANSRECKAYSRRERKTYQNPLTGANSSTYIYYHINENGQEVEGLDTNCVEYYKSSVKFQKLKVPYVDEFMIALEQGFMNLSFGAKYIYRLGKDDIRYVRSDYINLAQDEHYSNNYYTYTNEGKSWTNIIIFSVENKEAFKFKNTYHYLLFAFDSTQVKRNFNDYVSSMSLSDIEDELIVYDGKLIRSSQRPASNFVRPFTSRLTTTHLFEFNKMNFILNHFFRYRSAYDAIVKISNASGSANTNSVAYSQYKSEYKQYAQYGKYKIPASFSWDMRVGFQTKHRHSLYVNVDIYNVLDSKNTIINTTNYAGNSFNPTLGYEIGRQFWVQVGYRY